MLWIQAIHGFHRQLKLKARRLIKLNSQCSERYSCIQRTNCICGARSYRHHFSQLTCESQLSLIGQWDIPLLLRFVWFAWIVNGTLSFKLNNWNVLMHSNLIISAIRCRHPFTWHGELLTPLDLVTNKELVHRPTHNVIRLWWYQQIILQTWLPTTRNHWITQAIFDINWLVWSNISRRYVTESIEGKLMKMDQFCQRCPFHLGDFYSYFM